MLFFVAGSSKTRSGSCEIPGPLALSGAHPREHLARPVQLRGEPDRGGPRDPFSMGDPIEGLKAASLRPTPNHVAMTRLMENRRQARKVRWVLLASWIAAFVCLAWGWDLLHTYGMNPADGGILRPFPERLRAAVLITLMGWGTAVGMTVFARRYVVGLRLEAGHLHIATLGLWAGEPRVEKVPLRHIRGGRYFHGRLDTGRSAVHAPWITLRVRNRRLPYILDLQAESLKAERLASLLPAVTQPLVADPGRHP